MKSLPRLLRTALTVMVLGLTAAAFAAPAKRPNILWLIGEDFSPDLACYGVKQVWSPNLDRLAAQGMRFNRMFTTAPVCSAARSAFMTGMYQTTIGAHNHRSHRDDGYRVPAGVKPLPDWLRDAGYLAANIRELPAALGIRGSGKTDWNFTYPAQPFDSDKWSDLKGKQPFFAQINFSETHRTFKGPKKADPAKVDLPPIYPDHPIARADWAAYLDDASELDRKIGLVLQQLEADGVADDTIVLFMGDHGAAHVRAKQFVYDDGLRVPFIVRWAKNFPEPKGFKSGTVSDRIMEAIDVLPTLLDVAGAPKPAKMQGRILFGDRAEPAREYAFGARDRCDETVFRFRTVRDARYRYIKNFTPERPFLQANAYKQMQYPVWTLIQELGAQGKLTDWQKNFYLSPTMAPEELYDMESDPWSMNNLVASKKPADQVALARLRGVLEKWIVESDDQGRVLEPVAIAAAKGATRPDAAKQKKNKKAQ
ncbi:MAG: sulfatase [Opitutaceae bacterium]|nr:sulfatase [Opitutaceae bacterium]